MNEINNPRQRQVRSYVRRERKPSATKLAKFQKLWKKYGLAVEGMSNVGMNFINRGAPLVLEIGFGDGAFLAKIASKNPGINYVGIEVYRPGIEALCQILEGEQFLNVRIFREDALTVLKNAIAPASLSAVWLLFPDPWPKRRHHKRRLVNAEFLELLQQKLLPGGKFHFVTDWRDYADEVEKLIHEPATTAKYAFSVIEAEFLKVCEKNFMTRFGRRGLAAGREIFSNTFEVRARS